MADVSAEIIAAYANVLGIKEVSRVRAIVTALARKIGLEPRTFRDFYKDLAPISFDDITGKLETFTRRTEMADEIKMPSTVDVVNPASGSYGKIYVSNGGNAYKALKINKCDERAVRNVFLETFIQTVLSHDVHYGKYICKVERLYRLEKDARKPHTYSCLIKMEGLHQNVNDILAKKLDESVFIRNLAKLGEVLLHFDLNYAFRHRDMHYQNLMADKEGTLKIIDFGMACLTIGDTTYTTKSSKSSECESYDSLLMFASLLEGNDRKWITLQPRTINWIKGAFDMHPGNLYEAIKSTTTLAHVFHNMYFDNIKKWADEQQEWVAQSGRFTPEGFMKMTHKYLYALECVERDTRPCPKCGPVPLLPKPILMPVDARRRTCKKPKANGRLTRTRRHNAVVPPAVPAPAPVAPTAATRRAKAAANPTAAPVVPTAATRRAKAAVNMLTRRSRPVSKHD